MKQLVKSSAGDEIRALTGLRGVAACYIMIFHFFYTSVHSPTLFVPFRHGYLSVDLFFVLSGFVMALTYAGAFAKKTSFKTYAVFLYKRLGRIYPLYIVTTIVGIIAGAANFAPFKMPDNVAIIENILLIQSWSLSHWSITGSIDDAAWSISTEFLAYILFPLFVFVCLKSRQWAAFLVFSISVLILVFIAHHNIDVIASKPEWQGIGQLDISVGATPYPLLRCLAEFCLGMLIFRLSHTKTARRHFGAVVTNVMAILILISFCIRSNDVVTVLLITALIQGLVMGTSMTSRFLSTRVVYWFGTISYSIYLVHILVLSLIRPSVQEFLYRANVPHAYSFSVPIAIMLTLALAVLTFRFIEQPARNWSRRIVSRRMPPIQADPSAP